MPLASRAGRFHAYPAEIGVAETGPNSLTTVQVKYRLVEDVTGGLDSPVDVSHEGQEITGYHYVECRDGTVNRVTVESLKAAFGWDGRDPFWFEDSAAALAEKPVQVVLEAEEYSGRSRLKVKYLNPYGAEGSGGVTHADNATRRNIQNRLGAKLRAMAGGTPVQTTAKPKTAPKAPPPPKSASPVHSYETAWDAFVASEPVQKILSQPGKPGEAEAFVAKEFRNIVESMYPGRYPETLTPEEWAHVAEESSGMVVPF